MKTILFARVSSREQEETGYSLPSQEKLLREYSDKKEFRVAKCFSISESASGKSQRKIFNEMMVYAKKNNICVIICEKADRMTRNFKDMVDIDKWLDKDEKRQVHLVKDSLILHKNSRSQEKLNWGIRILFAKNYIDNLSEEVKKGQAEKIRQGWFPTTPPPGYKTIGEKGHKTITVEESITPLVVQMFKLYDTGNHSLKTLTEEVYKLGLRSTKGNKLSKSRVHKLLSNPFYIGRFLWKGEVYLAKHESIISKDLFDRVQVRMQSRTTPKYSTHSFLFKGKIRCVECGGVITWEVQKEHRYGHCNHYRNCSQQTWSREWEIEDQILDVFDLLKIRNCRLRDWLRKALKDSHKDKVEYYNASLNELEKQRKQVDKRLNRLYDALLDEKIPDDVYNEKLIQYKEEKSLIVSQIKNHSTANENYLEKGAQLFDASQMAKEIYLNSKSIEKKRDLLSKIFTKMTIDEGELSYEYTPAYQILAKAVEKTNSSKIQKVAKKAERNFELKEKSDNMPQTDAYEAYRPILLRG